MSESCKGLLEKNINADVVLFSLLLNVQQ